jgi:hypothetical protein
MLSSSIPPCRVTSLLGPDSFALVRAALTASGTVTECCIAVSICTKLRRMSANQCFWICDVLGFLFQYTRVPFNHAVSASLVGLNFTTCDTEGDRGDTRPSFHLYIISPATLSNNHPLPKSFLFILETFSSLFRKYYPSPFLVNSCLPSYV